LFVARARYQRALVHDAVVGGEVRDLERGRSGVVRDVDDVASVATHVRLARAERNGQPFARLVEPARRPGAVRLPEQIVEVVLASRGGDAVEYDTAVAVERERCAARARDDLLVGFIRTVARDERDPVDAGRAVSVVCDVVDLFA